MPSLISEGASPIIVTRTYLVSSLVDLTFNLEADYMRGWFSKRSMRNTTGYPPRTLFVFLGGELYVDRLTIFSELRTLLL